MMNQLLMSAESMVAITVVGSLVLSAVVLTIRTLTEKQPAKQQVEIRRERR